MEKISRKEMEAEFRAWAEYKNGLSFVTIDGYARQLRLERINKAGGQAYKNMIKIIGKDSFFDIQIAEEYRQKENEIKKEIKRLIARNRQIRPSSDPSTRISGASKKYKEFLEWRENNKPLPLRENVGEEEEYQRNGEKRQITTNVYERDDVARKQCIAYYKSINNGRIRCAFCKFDFEKIYGERGKGFIHVHHIEPLAESAKKGKPYKENPKKDLIPVCPNCHEMIHRWRRDTLTPDELREILKENS